MQQLPPLWASAPTQPGADGAAEVNGMAIPIFAPTDLLDGQPVTVTSQTRLVVTNCQAGSKGIIADAVISVTMIADGDVKSLPAVLASETPRWLRGVIMLPDSLLLVLDLCEYASLREPQIDHAKKVTQRLFVEDRIADALRELGNIGAGHAAAAFSEFVGESVTMRVPLVELVPFDEVTEALGGPETPVAVTYVRVSGDVSGHLFVIQSLDGARHLLSSLVPAVGEELPLDAMAESVLGELGNIMAAHYLSSLTEFTHLAMRPSVPSVAVDMAQAILTMGMLEENPLGDFALVIHTAINGPEKQGSAHVFLFPSPGSERVLLRSLGIEGGL